MDALMRSVRLAPERTRLSDAGGDRLSAQGQLQRQRDALRQEIEQQVRAELAAQIREIHASEREKARAEGLEAAVAEATANAEQDLALAHEELKTRLESAICAMEQAHQAALARLESSAGEVAFAAVCRMLAGQAGSQAFVLGLVERACSVLRVDPVATARLHPRDIETLRELLQDQELRVQSLGLKVIPDESLELGGCVIEAASGQYDGGLETQLRRLHSVLVGNGDSMMADGAAHASTTRARPRS